MLNFGKSESLEAQNAFVLLTNKYSQQFATNLSELPQANVPKVRIVEKPNSWPVASKPYRSNATEVAKMSELISSYREDEIVVDMDSPLAAPAFLTLKKDGNYCPVFDFCKLNAQTERINFPLPNIDDHLADLSLASCFTVLDLFLGYLQIPLDEESLLKTAFISTNESGMLTRVPFGLCNAPAKFSRIMMYILGNLRNCIAFNYMDDVLILGKLVDGMLHRLEQVLIKLKEAKLACRLEKCLFAHEQIEFLGFEIADGQV